MQLDPPSLPFPLASGWCTPTHSTPSPLFQVSEPLLTFRLSAISTSSLRVLISNTPTLSLGICITTPDDELRQQAENSWINLHSLKKPLWQPTVFVSNLCYLIKRLQLFPACFFLHTLCYFINFCRLIKLSSSYQTFVIFSLLTLPTHPINVPAVHTILNTTLSCLIVRTPSAPIHLSNSPGVFGHRAILIWGDRDMIGGFLEEQPVTFTFAIQT